MELYLELAGIRIRILSDDDLLKKTGILSDYIAGPGFWEQTYHVRVVDSLPLPRGTLLFSDPSTRVYETEDSVIRYSGCLSAGPSTALSYLKRRDCGCELQFPRSQLYEGITSKLLLSALEVEHLVTVNRGFLLHASYIICNGRAILFTAPSETGKSTQAQLWCDHAGAELVNGDRAAVRIMDGQAFACGIPFSGSSAVRRNVTAPLAAIVYLSQAPENSILRLKGARAFRRVWEGCTVDTWDKADMDLASDTVSEVVGLVPVYHLACTPDVRAVELLKRTMEVDI